MALQADVHLAVRGELGGIDDVAFDSVGDVGGAGSVAALAVDALRQIGREHGGTSESVVNA